jgi:hypothetical protein
MADRRGHRTAETLLRIDERDKLLAEAALRLPQQSALAAAHKLHEILSRYRAGAWRRECAAESVPPRRIGQVEEFCWKILRLRDYRPSTRTIRRALAANKS